MKLLIAGSREVFPSIQEIDAVIECCEFSTILVSEVISGTAAGADTAGEKWAKYHKIKVTRMPANWALYGKEAGNMRNAQMANLADYGLIFWDGKSGGSANMVAHLAIRDKHYKVLNGNDVLNSPCMR